MLRTGEVGAVVFDCTCDNKTALLAASCKAVDCDKGANLPVELVENVETTTGGGGAPAAVKPNVDPTNATLPLRAGVTVGSVINACLANACVTRRSNKLLR